MKKMKRFLAVLSSVSMMLGTMGMSTFADEVRNEYGRTLSEQALYDAENAKEKLAELLAELEEMGYTENEQTKFLETYIDGALEVAASGATYAATPTESKLYEIPESITSIKELEDFITSPVEISAKDYVRLSNQMTAEELEEFFKSNGVSDSDAELNVNAYYDGMKQVAESNCTFVIYPGGVETDYVPELPQTPLGVQQVERLTETSGTFEGGVTYFYNEETKGLIFDGNGELSEEDFTKAMNSFDDIEFIFFGNDITFECHYGARFTAFFHTLNENWYNVVERPFIPVYTYEGSEFTRQFDECINEIGANASNFKYYTVEDGTDPYTFVNTLPELPTQIIDGGCFWAVDETHTSPTWYYEGTVYDGVSEGILLIASIHNDPYTLDDVLKVVGDYAVTEVHLGAEMSVLPVELQNCETIEEAEAELLRLINEAKADEQQVEAVNCGTPTIAGDIDLNEEQGIADIVALTKYNASPELFPISDKTALANADVNQDGKIDALDTAILVEMALGNYESAV